MDHIVYLDFKSKELDKLLSGTKTMIIRGAAGRKLPHGRVFDGDRLFFVNNNGEGLVKAKAVVKSAVSSEKLEKEDSVRLVQKNLDRLQLTEAQQKRWGGKRYLVLVEIKDVEAVEPFPFNRSAYSNMDDWLPVENIENVKT